jgi:hypothetical protein
MRIQATFLSLLVASALTACGGSGEAPSFDDPVTALEAAESARSTGETATAEAGYGYAAEHGDAKTKYRALLGLGKLLAGTDPAGAAAAFEKARTECADQYDIAGAQAMIDTWIKAGNLDEGKALLAAAAAQFPDQKDALATQEAGLAAVESGDADSLAELGYVGD